MQQDGEAALPDGRVRAPVRGGAGVLGPRQQPGRALLLDDLHSGKDDMGWILDLGAIKLNLHALGKG